MSDPELEKIDRWASSLATTEDRVEMAYHMMRGNHRSGELPRHIRNAWVDAPADYRQFLVDLVQRVLDLTPSI